MLRFLLDFVVFIGELHHSLGLWFVEAWMVLCGGMLKLVVIAASPAMTRPTKRRAHDAPRRRTWINSTPRETRRKPRTNTCTHPRQLQRHPVTHEGEANDAFIDDDHRLNTCPNLRSS